MSNKKIDRRQFLKKSGSVAIGSAAILQACASPADPMNQNGDMRNAQDMQDMLDMAKEMSIEDMQDLQQMDQGQEDISQDASDMAGAIAVVSKPPFIQLTAANTARLRLETRTPEALEVELVPMSAPMATEYQTKVMTTNLDYAWPNQPIFLKRTEFPDEPGDHTLHELVFTDLKPGELYAWKVHLGNGEELSGSFLSGVPAERGFRLGWIADTMYPDLEQTAPLLASIKPEFTLHGGDLQYMSNPFDTWNGAFQRLSKITSMSAFHICIGNHEYEEQNEFDDQYRRLFSTQNISGNVDYHYVDFGHVRFFMMNSEIEFGTDSPQMKWLRGHLEKLPASMMPVVAFHRPYYTFAKSPRLSLRDAIHPVMKEFKIPLVLTGHHHCYERFEVEGITYVVDGGGGAGLYNPDGAKDEILMARPQEEALRKAHSWTFGVLQADFKSDKTISFERRDVTNKIVDTFTVG